MCPTRATPPTLSCSACACRISGSIDDAFSSREPDSTSLENATLLIAQHGLDFLAEFRGDILARERVAHIGGEEADLRAAVEAASVEFQPVEGLLLGQRQHGIGELDLAAGA